MVRKGPNRQSLNSSIVTVTNNSIVEDEEQPDYCDFIKRFDVPDLDENFEIVGQKETIDLITSEIEELLEPNFKKPQLVLVTGPEGSGKTVVIRKLAQQYSDKVKFFYLLTSWTQDKQFGVPESRVKQLFDEAIKKAPSVILLDKMDLICPERQNDIKERVVNAIQHQLNRLKSPQTTPPRVMVLFATTRPELLKMHMERRYLATEIRFKLPSPTDRLEIIEHILKPVKHNISRTQFEQIVKFSHCYSYEDLEELVRLALKRAKKAGSNTLCFEHINAARLNHKPVAVQSVVTRYNPLGWQDIGGGEEAKSKLQKKVIKYISNRTGLHKIGARFKMTGALLYGPPGCSKTMLARALATESGYNFISVKGSEVHNKYVGESEAKVSAIYRHAREIAPCIVFFDEIDAMAPERCRSQNSNVDDKVVAALLTELDGVDSLDDVFTIAATNRPDRVDKALIRPGRLNPLIYIPLPSEADRVEIFKVGLKDVMMEDKESLIGPLANLTSGYSGAEIIAVCEEAIEAAYYEDERVRNVEWAHFERALEEVKPDTSKELLKIYEKFGGCPRQESLEGSSKKMARQKLTSLNRLMSSFRIKAQR